MFLLKIKRNSINQGDAKYFKGNEPLSRKIQAQGWGSGLMYSREVLHDFYNVINGSLLLLSIVVDLKKKRNFRKIET